MVFVETAQLRIFIPKCYISIFTKQTWCKRSVISLLLDGFVLDTSFWNETPDDSLPANCESHQLREEEKNPVVWRKSFVCLALVQNTVENKPFRLVLSTIIPNSIYHNVIKVNEKRKVKSSSLVQTFFLESFKYTICSYSIISFM